MPAHADISSLLAHHAATHPDAVAFIDGERTITYGEFARLCEQSAAWLARNGVASGDRVAVWLVNRLEWLTLYFGLSRLNAALIAINTRYRSHELAYILQRSAATMLVLEPGFRKIDFAAVLGGVDPAAASALRRVAVIERGGSPAPEQILGLPTTPFSLDDLSDETMPAAGQPDALNLLFTTSGTTSGPKLVMHSQRTITVHSQHVADHFGLRERGARLLAALPFCGVFGLNGVLGAFAAGAPVVIMDTFDAARAVDLITRHQITHTFGSDEMFQRMLECAPHDAPFPSARLFGFAAFHPGAEQLGLEAWRRGVPMFGLYGSSEVQALFSVNDARTPLPDRLKGGGMPCNPAATVRIRDVETGDVLPVGQSGAVEIRADTNFIGYLDNPEATAKVVGPDGFFSTGDVGYLRPDGGFVYETRQGDAIRLAGYLVSPVEIEDLLKQQPGIRNAQIVGVELDGRSQCAAFVILAPGGTLDEAALKASLGATLAPYKVPVRIWAIAEFPTTQSSNGVKIQRNKLRDLAMKTLENPA